MEEDENSLRVTTITKREDMRRIPLRAKEKPWPKKVGAMDISIIEKIFIIYFYILAQE